MNNINSGEGLIRTIFDFIEKSAYIFDTKTQSTAELINIHGSKFQT